jgi:tRNA dimethylallyltransferase
LRRRQTVTPPRMRIFSVLLDYDLDCLRPRIAARVDHMMAAGFLDEVRALREAGHGDARAMQALGYKQLGQHLDGVLTLEAAVADIKTATAAYARRQRTWFRRESINLRTYQAPVPAALARLIRGWLLV